MTSVPAQAGRSPAQTRALWLGALALAAVAVWVASALAWTCDDAYIAFRYASNARDGRGLVWNPEPFAPVEGYTCYAWVMLLWGVWEVFGAAPPDAANALSIGFGVALLWVTFGAARRVVDDQARPLPAWCVLIALACVACNRTSLSWFTSGLETAMFNLAFVSWVLLAFRADTARSSRHLLRWSSWASLAALTRPDGLLLVAATAAAAAMDASRRDRSWRATLAALAPLLAVAAHLVWRRATYGEWLPNTYFAKVTTPWPEAGLRYLACFGVEQGAWLWPLVSAPWVVVALARARGGILRVVWERLPAFAAAAVVIFHVGYYCLRVGGDPFEYRVLSYLIPLGAVGVLAAAAQLPGGSRTAGVAVSLLFTAGLAGWGHRLYHEPSVMPFYAPIAAEVPALLRPIARWHDRQMAWLKPQVLCGRPRVHAMWLEEASARLPARQRGGFDLNDVPVLRERGVGLPGWVLPDVAVLDEHGLNDWVVARGAKAGAPSFPVSRGQLEAVFSSLSLGADGRYAREDMLAVLADLGGAALARGLVDFLLLQLAPPGADSLAPSELVEFDRLLAGLRFMAHERLPPAEYVEDLSPNVEIRDRQAVVTPRPTPLSAERVRELEVKWRDRVRAQRTR